MTRTISQAERRAVEHENIARESIENADVAVAMAEREMLELGGSGDPHAEIRQRLLSAYAEARRHLGFGASPHRAGGAADELQGRRAAG